MRPDEIIEQQLLAQIEAKTQQVYAQHGLHDPNLRTSLCRAATSVLMYARDHGQIKNFAVRCDESSASPETDGLPVVEVNIEFFKRVRQFTFKME